MVAVTAVRRTPVRRTQACRATARRTSTRRTTGLTLVEVLVAGAIAAALWAAVAGTFVIAARTANGTSVAVSVSQRRALAGSLLRHEIELAGRGLDDGGLAFELDPLDAGGDRIRVRYLAEAHRVDPVRIDATFDARRDGQGRWNLYRTPAGSVRQPWLLGVRGLRVTEGRDGAGAKIARSALADRDDLTAVRLEIQLDEAESVVVWASTARSRTVASSRDVDPAPEAP